MAKLRVVHIIPRLDIGAAELGTIYGIEHLNTTTFEPFLISGPGGALEAEILAKKKFPVHICPELSREPRPLADNETFNALRKLIKELKPDLVHTHRQKAGVVGRLAAAAESVRAIVHTYHGFGFHQYAPPGAYTLAVALNREANRRSNYLIFLSFDSQQRADDLDLIQNCGISLIRPGVEIEPMLQAKPSDEFREKYEIAKRTKVVGMISALRPQKDPLTFIEAAALVVAKDPDTKFLLFGDGELANAVRRRAAKKLGAHQFLQVGWTRNVAEVLANLDALVVPSLWEGLPRVVVEATIMGVPVIASDIGGIREIIIEEKNGGLCEPQNAEQFAEKISTALDRRWKVDPELSRQMQYEFDIRETLRQEEDVYIKLCNA